MKNETFTPERIKAEADAFFEWDGEDRSLVTTTSCLLFAQHIAGLMKARAAQPAPVVPEGYVLVPVEPTREMEEAGCQGYMRADGNSIMHLSSMGHAYVAMLAAAPAQGQQVDEWDAIVTKLEDQNQALRDELSALKAQQEKPKAEVCMGCVEQSSRIRELEHKMDFYKAQQVGQEPVEGIHRNPYPAKCPITGLPYFMHLEHPEHGVIPTFGGPYDSYSIPHAEGSPDELWHKRELVSHRYCHDRGHWVDDEFIPLRIIHEDVLSELQDNATPQPAPAQDVTAVLKMARALSDRQADACNVDREDQWKLYSEDFVADVEAMLAAARDKRSGEVKP